MDRRLLLQQQQQIQLVPTTTSRGGGGTPPACATATSVPPMMQPQDDGARSSAGMCTFLHWTVYQGATTKVMAQLPKPKQQVAAVDCRPTEGELIVDLQEEESEVLQTVPFMHGECSIHEVTVGRNTVVHVAAAHGHHELIQELYLRFRNHHQGLLSDRNSALDTPLHCAARAGHAPAVNMLAQLARDSGQRIDILGCKNEAGDTALHLAARHGHGAAVEALVVLDPAAAAELNNAGASALYLAVISGSMEAVRAITTSCCGAGAAASSAGPSSQNALHAAVLRSLEMVELLLAWRPALADQADCDGSTPLHFAASGGDLAVVRAILGAHPAPPPRTMYHRDSCGQSALHVAARMGHAAVVGAMIPRCLDVCELRDDDGRTFVHTAAMAKRSSVVALASSHFLGGLLDTQDKDGNTPLHLAVAAGATGVVEGLLRDGKVRAGGILNNDGHTAFDLVAGAATGSGGGGNFFTMVSLVVTLVAYGAAQLGPQRQDRLKPWTTTRDMALIDKTSDSLAVVAVLIATSAFAAGFNLPGGYDSDDGKAVLARKVTFKWFLCLDTVAVAASLVAVVLLVYGKASRSAGSWKTFVLALHCMWVSLLSLLMALYAVLASVLGARAAYFYVLIAIYHAIYFLSFFIVKWIGPDAKLRTVWRFLCRRRSRGNEVTRRQYPLAGATVLNLILFSVTSFLCLIAMGFILAKSLEDQLPRLVYAALFFSTICMPVYLPRLATCKLSEGASATGHGHRTSTGTFSTLENELLI